MNHLPCIHRNAGSIEAAVAESERMGVPPAVMFAVGLHESHLGCHPRSGGCWGAPLDFRHRGTAGTHVHAARVLLRGRERCGDWRGAVGWFRSGKCRPPRNAGYVRSVMSLAADLDRRAAAR